MAKLLLIPIISLLLCCSISKCSATVYTVGDNGGWDISTDLDSWKQGKTFVVGDTLLFQYSKYHSVSEVTKENYEGCNTGNVLQTSSNSNTSFALTRPGDRYFVCGNRLHCLGGMKLHVNVVGNQALSPFGSPVGSPVGSPEAQPGGVLPPAGSSSTSNPISSSFVNTIGVDRVLIEGFVASLSVLFCVM
ncbi:Cupredoxin superfamily protein [Striga hermonthica]|uniref:Cupredoxin superfamily protein n=1 Tax=Striga hermonthica TaxID=68872 RepID=A0A9N7NS38_STRHE|nr:Cupredoxin superfamily protein [Striga hermonthica]